MYESPIPVNGESTPETSETVKKANKRKLIWGLICLIGPTALIVISLLLYAVINFIIATSAPEVAECPPAGVDSIAMGACASEGKDQALFEKPSPVSTISNVVLFLVGAISVLTWLPGIIVGIILLATRKPVPVQ
ncbi:hypothetical protein H7142_00430 [Candidatus Saccharibacteria bacterium]|nr:hypothetical protein [Candidatus Saccharibacteria bacterium]